MQMQFGELFVQTARSLLANKLRSFLTMFGIAWGILSIMLMMAVGAGLEKGQQDVALTLGKDILIIHGGVTGLQAGGERAGRRIWIDYRDASLIKSDCPSVQYVTPEIGQQVLARSAYNSGNLGVSGAWPIFKDIRTQILAHGRFHNDGDEADGRRVAVLGWEVRAQLYGGRDPVGEMLYLNGIPYQVIGYLAKKDQDSNYDGPDNSKIFVPFHAMMADFPNKPPRHASNIDDIVIMPRSVEEHTRADAEVRTVLGRKYGFDPQDKDALSIWDTVESAELFHKMTTSMQLFLGTVGVVTLFLGGIGVMNIMLVSVTERTREIGVRMAVGATKREIAFQFFTEATIISF